MLLKCSIAKEAQYDIWLSLIETVLIVIFHFEFFFFFILNCSQNKVVAPAVVLCDINEYFVFHCESGDRATPEKHWMNFTKPFPLVVKYVFKLE